MSDATDEDLRDVFKLLYDETDEWGGFDDDNDHPPLDSIAPEIEIETVEEDVQVRNARTRDLERYSKKRYLSDLDALLFHTHPNKKQRIYPPARSPPSQSKSIASTSRIPVLPDPSIYAPFSPLALLARLRTFQPSTYSPAYPSELGPVPAALSGWCNDGREGLKCGQCGVKWGLGGFEDIKDDRVRMEVAKRLSRGFASRHATGCAWNVRRCPADLVKQLRGMLHPIVSTSLAALALRLEDQCVAGPSRIRWTSPLAEDQTSTLVANLQPSAYYDNEEEEAGITTSMDKRASSSSSITALSASLAFFSWYPYRPSQVTDNLSTQTTDIVSCRICQRRVGLWAFHQEKSEEKPFDLVSEHLVWCPIRQDEWWRDVCILQSRLISVEEPGETPADGKPRMKVRVKDVKISEGVKRRAWWR